MYNLQRGSHEVESPKLRASKHVLTAHTSGHDHDLYHKQTQRPAPALPGAILADLQRATPAAGPAQGENASLWLIGKDQGAVWPSGGPKETLKAALFPQNVEILPII